MNTVVVAGSVNVDLTSYLDRWPSVGETLRARETRISLGGKGANQAVAAARAGSPVTLIGAIGVDGFGRDMTDTLVAEGISLRLTRKEDCATGMAFIDVGPDGGNIIRLAEGANGLVSAADIRAEADVFAQARVLLLQNEIPLDAALEATRIARAAGCLVIMDPAPAPDPIWPIETLAAFDILTPNAHETRLMLGSEPTTLDEAEAAARALAKQASRGALLTLGALGVAWCIDGATGQCAAPSVEAIDTVGAGDCFNGALASALASGRDIPQAMRFAVCAASLATTRAGASIAMPRRDEIEGCLNGAPR